MKQFSLVTTVYNEIRRLEQTIANIEAQTLQPTEIVITDAGSSDGTFERLLKWKNESNIPIVVLQKLKCNIAEGRNLAIKTAKYNLIASTDFGCRYHPEWLESLIQVFEDETINVVGGAFSVIEKDIVTIAGKADYVLSKAYSIPLKEYAATSSRSIAYYKYIWDEIGGYPEWLTLAADDTVFWRLILKSGYKYQLIDKPYVFWERHKSFLQFGKETFRYGLGDGESGINYRNFYSHIIETSLRYLFILNLILLPFTLRISIIIPLIIFVFSLPGLRSYKNTLRNWLLMKSGKYNLRVLFASIYLVEISRFFYIRGYIKGRFLSNKEVLVQRKKLQQILS
jgi:glycosyltransferase involved in cell wall biosynthesis